MVDDYFIPIYCILPKECVVKEISISKRWIRNLHGYHSGTMRIRFKNQFVYYGSARVDPMLKSFFAEISSRPSCYQCHFKSVERCSDFTIYDCWHANNLVERVRLRSQGVQSAAASARHPVPGQRPVVDQSIRSTPAIKTSL